MGVDWTAHMRATPSVLEYILIGEMASSKSPRWLNATVTM